MEYKPQIPYQRERVQVGKWYVCESLGIARKGVPGPPVAHRERRWRGPCQTEAEAVEAEQKLIQDVPSVRGHTEIWQCDEASA